MKQTRRFRHFLAVASTSIFVGNSAQADVTKANNTNSLSLGSSYVGGSLPTSSDLLIIDGIWQQTTSVNLGGNVSILGINQTTAATKQLQVNNSPGAVLTIYSGGITQSSTTVNLILANAVTLGANQTWSTVSGRSIQMNGTFNDGGKTLAVSGAGTFDLRGSNSFGSNVTIDSTVSVNSAGAIVTFGGANTMNSLAVPSGRVVGATLGNFGVASNFGDGGTNTAITLGNATNGVMEYSGVTASSNRTINRDARSSASGIDVTNANETLTLSGNMGSGTQVNAGSNGWAFGGAGNLTLNGVISNATGTGSTGTTISKNGSGTLTLGSNSNTYTGTTDVYSGKLLINGNVSTSSLTTVKTGATLGGTGTVGALVVNSNGTFAPGDNGIESLNVSGNLTLDGGSFSVFEINTAGDISDLAISTALLSFGGTLTVTNIGGALVAGDVFNLFDWATSSGSFASVNLPGLDTGLAWDPSNLYSTGQISVIAVPEPDLTTLIGGLGTLALLRRRRTTGSSEI